MIIGSNSNVSPELESIRIISSLVTIPKSPCAASAGCIKKEGVPVEEKVADIFFAIMPDLPTPVRIKRPFSLFIIFIKFDSASL